MSHTPGPWRLINNSWSTTGIYADDSRVAKDWRIGEVTIEQEATEDNQYELEKIMEANARLIAAAPRLLAAAKLALVELERIKSTGDYDPQDEVAALSAAIEEAEGVTEKTGS